MYFATEANVGMTLSGGGTPVLKLFGTASTGSDAGIVFDGEAQDYHIGLYDTGDTLVIGRGSTLGTTAAINIGTTGHVSIGRAGGTDSAATAFNIQFPAESQSGSFDWTTHDHTGGAVTITGSATNVTTMTLYEPNITIDGGSVTNAATLRIVSAPPAITGVGNEYALWVDDGPSRFDGTITCTSLTETSDITAKENIVTIDTAIDTVKKLRPVTFDWKEDKKESAGFIAQEVEEVIPYVVEGTGNEYKSIKSFGILAQVTKALQESIDKIETLEKKVEELQGA